MKIFCNIAFTNFIYKSIMLKEGIYEKLISQEVEIEIKEAKQYDLVCKTDKMDIAESPSILSKYLANLIGQKLQGEENIQNQVKYINSILHTCGVNESINEVKSEELLMEVMSKDKYRLQQESNTTTVRPISGFRVSNLFTGGNSQLSLGEEIRREIASADRISFIVSFLKVSGLRIFLNDLTNFCKQEGKSLRIITTTYCGVTEPKAMKMISELSNTEIRISYNTNIERLHAKAYIFERNSGMNTVYIGSSNLSKSAQTDGLEWNIRITNEESPHIIKTALATFEMYWNSPNFENFRVGGIKKFNEELRRNDFHEDDKIVYQHYSLLPHQKQILDKLQVEREQHHNYRNLIVAATGTGKTVISAFDYSDFCNKHNGMSNRLLYIAHRGEILEQSLSTYRSVLHKADFGTLWVGNYSPKEESDFEHLFVSVSMFNSRFEDFFKEFPEKYYDYIVIDEAHHSQANSYRKLFEHFNPQLLVGLTATPERMDGRDLRPDFGGRISAEIRLPQALQAGLLTPFQYLCITDNTDLRDDSLWDGRYIVNKLADKLCNTDRVQNIVDALYRYLVDENKCRALCFCVNIKHADFMAEQLRNCGFKAQSITTDTPREQRIQYANDIRSGNLNYLCIVDVFNEGVDLPEIDTVLFLRPTDSLTIFLQQLGRGLRLSPGKSELTVLDFIAQVHKKYDYASRFRALMMSVGESVKKQVENGFTTLPFGCSIIMEKVAKQHILENIQNAIYNRSRIINDLKSYQGILSIKVFLETIGQNIHILYRNGCWTSLKRDAGKISYMDDSVTIRLEKGMKNFLHHNTASFLHFVEGFVNGNENYRKGENVTYATMLYYILYGDRIDRAGFKDTDMYYALERIHDMKYNYFKEEIKEIVTYLLSNLEITTYLLGDKVLPGLELYGCYTREEIFTLVGRQTADRRMQGTASGVFHLQKENATLLFVTLNKSDKDFSPSTQYDDYVIDVNHFHWQSQNTDSHNNKRGLTYIQQAQTKRKIILFVRKEKKDSCGTSPFHCFGFVNYVESHGDFPMNVTWKLKSPIMAQYMKVV